MKDDLISRKELRKAFKKCPFFTEVYLYYARQLIDNAPTVEQECYITGAQWNEFMKEHKRRQDTLITEIIEELESRKDYGIEYAQAMENAIVIIKAKFGVDKEVENE